MLGIKKPDFEKGQKTFRTSYRLIKMLFKVNKGIFFGNLIVFAIPAIIPFVNAYIYKLIIDLVVASITTSLPFNYHQFFILLLFRVTTLLVQDYSYSLQTYIEQITYYKFPAHIYSAVLGKISGLDMYYFENSSFRDTLEKVRSSYEWRPLNMMSSLFYMYQSVLQVIIAFVALIFLNPIFIVIILLFSIPAFIVQTKYASIEWGIWHDTTPKRKKFYYISGLLQDSASIKEIKIFQTATKFLTEMNSLYGSYVNKGVRSGKKLFRTNILLNTISVAIYTGIEVYIVFLAIIKQITIGSVSYYIQVVSNFQMGVGGLFRNATALFAQSLYVDEIFKVMDAPEVIPRRRDGVILDSKFPPKIEFRNISFSYPDSDEKVFDNFSLIIEPGEKIALVGENGAGKTTLMKLLARFYDVDFGQILINDIDIKDLDLSSWYKKIGILFQDFMRYEYSLEDNIYFGKVWEEKSLEEIKEAAKFAGASEIAEQLTHGYQQILGKTFDDGEELSVGQWQKVALARAFLRDAPILILDEPTASIDAKAEAEIFGKVDRLSKDKTVIIISHRFSTVRNADRIYVIKKGKIREQGSHEELMEQKGIYSTLFNLQAKGYQ